MHTFQVDNHPTGTEILDPPLQYFRLFKFLDLQTLNLGPTFGGKRGHGPITTPGSANYLQAIDYLCSNDMK